MIDCFGTGRRTRSGSGGSRLYSVHWLAQNWRNPDCPPRLPFLRGAGVSVVAVAKKPAFPTQRSRSVFLLMLFRTNTIGEISLLRCYHLDDHGAAATCVSLINSPCADGIESYDIDNHGVLCTFMLLLWPHAHWVPQPRRHERCTISKVLHTIVSTVKETSSSGCVMDFHPVPNWERLDTDTHPYLLFPFFLCEISAVSPASLLARHAFGLPALSRRIVCGL